MMSDEVKRNVLQPLTVRFTPDAWEAISDIADENHVSMAELVRMSVAGNLYKYLGDIRIIDEEQADEIKRAIITLYGVMSKIENELHRIGVNYNQEVRLKNIEKKYGNRIGMGTAQMKYQEQMKVVEECQGFNKEELDRLIRRYEIATSKVGDALCRIVG